MQWSNSGQQNNGQSPTTGLLLDVEMVTPALPQITKISLFDFSNPNVTGQYLPVGGYFSAVPIPELSSLYLLVTGLVGLAVLKLRTVYLP